MEINKPRGYAAFIYHNTLVYINVRRTTLTKYLKLSQFAALRADYEVKRIENK